MIKFFNRKNKNNKGFGLIEVLISVAIMSIVTLPLAQSFVTSSQVNKKSEVKLSAITVAENRMEQAKAIDLSMYEKAEDGKYYISEDAVDENGNTFNVQTIIDPTKYEQLNSGIYDISTLSFASKAEIEIPEDLLGKYDKKYTYYSIILDIFETQEDESIYQSVYYTITIAQNSTGKKSKIIDSGLLFYYGGEEYDENGNYLGLSNLDVRYYEKQNMYLGEIRINNLDDVDVTLNLTKFDRHDNRSNDINVYEGGNNGEGYPYTRIGQFLDINLNDGSRESDIHIDPLYSINGSKLRAWTPKGNEYIDFDNSSYKISSLEVMHAVEVSVYEYVDSDDESVKYDDGLLLTKLEGSKIVDY
jgi:prepilin-type N-terminal cleavage/methylation domain-containing protein